MPKAELKLKNAEAVKNAITKAQRQKIMVMYKNLARKTAKEAEKLKSRDNVSSILRVKYLNILEKQMNDEVKKISRELESTIKEDAKKVTEAVVEANKEWAKKVGMSIKGAWSRIPTDVVNSIATGQVYESGWSLSKRIWGIQEKTMQDIHTVVAEGIASNKGVYEIAKDLEKYVDPKAKKDWNWSKVYPNTNKKVDYNAQRLARTLTQHAYQQSFKETTQDNPFITKYKWLSSNDHDRVCPICKERNGKLFDKDKLPLDHPNGMCTWVAVMEKDWDKITDDIANWFNSPEGTNPAMDKFANKVYGTGKAESKVKIPINKEKENVKVPEVKTKNVVPKSFKDLSDKYGVEFKMDEDMAKGYVEGDIDEKVFKDIDENIQLIQSKLPKEYHFKNICDKVEFGKYKRQAGSAIDKEMTMNIDYLNKTEEGYANTLDSVQIRYKSTGITGAAKTNTAIETFTHEYGHLVHDELFRRTKKKDPLSNASGLKTQNSKIRKDVLSKFDLDATAKNYGPIAKGLSSYSTESPHEFFAEAFMEFIDNPTPRPIAEEFGETLLKLLNESVK